MVVDLPVVTGHEVFAGVERPAVEDADAPIEVGADELLGDEEVGIFEDRITSYNVCYTKLLRH